MDPVQSRPTQAARDALMIQGVFLLSMGTTAAVTPFLDKLRDDYYGVMGMGFSAALGFGGWSLWLALRALRQGDLCWRVAVVFSLCLLEVACFAIREVALCAMLGPGIRDPIGGNAVLVAEVVGAPVLVIAALVGLPVAWWRTRHAERRALESGMPAVTVRRLWSRLALWFVIVTLLVSMLLVPCPLFLGCLWMSRKRADPFRKVVERTPVAVGEASAWLLTRVKHPKAAQLYDEVLRTGRVSTRRLMAELSSPASAVHQSAFGALTKADPAAALDVALRIGDGRLAAPKCVWQAAEQVARRGTREQILPFLEPAQTPPPPAGFVASLVRYISHGKRRKEFGPELERLCRGDFPDRAQVLQWLAYTTSVNNVEDLWGDLLLDRNAARRKQAMAVVSGIFNVQGRPRILLRVLKSADPQLRDELVATDAIMRGLCVDDSVSRDERICLAKLILPYLDDEDQASRANAAWFLAVSTKAPAEMIDAAEKQQAANRAGRRAVPIDNLLQGQIREHVERWLEKQ